MVDHCRRGDRGGSSLLHLLSSRVHQNTETTRQHQPEFPDSAVQGDQSQRHQQHLPRVPGDHAQIDLRLDVLLRHLRGHGQILDQVEPIARQLLDLYEGGGDGWPLLPPVHLPRRHPQDKHPGRHGLEVGCQNQPDVFQIAGLQGGAGAGCPGQRQQLPDVLKDAVVLQIFQQLQSGSVVILVILIILCCYVCCCHLPKL